MTNKEKALGLRVKGATYQNIADQLGMTRQRVHQLLTGYTSPCKARSRREYMRRRRQTEEGKEIHRRQQKRYHDRVKNLVLTHYGKGKLKCVKCGFSDARALSIDHINGGGTQHKADLGIRTGYGFYGWLAASGYPEGYQTLCMNCQFVKRYENNELARANWKIGFTRRARL